MSALGVDFPRERFLRTPVRIIMDLIQYIDNEEQRQYNLASSATAMLSYQVVGIASGMGGEKVPEHISTDTFLPFPRWKAKENLFTEEQPAMQRPENDPTPSNRSTTKQIMLSLLKQRRIPPDVFLALNPLLS